MEDNSLQFKNNWLAYIDTEIEVITSLKEMSQVISSAISMIHKSLTLGGTIFWCGNGGSAADAQHLAAELVGRFKANRKALSSIALTTDSSVITSIANDFNYEEIFSRQVEANVKNGDVLIGISTSGKSINVLRALEIAKKNKAKTILLSGRKWYENNKYEFDLELIVNSEITSHIQEAHISIGQFICGEIERMIVNTESND